MTKEEAIEWARGPSLREAAQQALEALEAGPDVDPIFAGETADALRTVLAEPAQEPVACLIGTRGSAFDSPTTKRAYTYAEQPGNVVASRLGLACNAAASQSAGDSIDRGLGLLQELQKQGFGVFDLGAECAAPPQRLPLTDDEIRDLFEAEFLGGYGMRSWDDDLQVFRLAEQAHGIK